MPIWASDDHDSKVWQVISDQWCKLQHDDRQPSQPKLQHDDNQPSYQVMDSASLQGTWDGTRLGQVLEMLPGWGQVVAAWICTLIYECAYVELQVCVDGACGMWLHNGEVRVGDKSRLGGSKARHSTASYETSWFTMYVELERKLDKVQSKVMQYCAKFQTSFRYSFRQVSDKHNKNCILQCFWHSMI